MAPLDWVMRTRVLDAFPGLTARMTAAYELIEYPPLAFRSPWQRVQSDAKIGCMSGVYAIDMPAPGVGVAEAPGLGVADARGVGVGVAVGSGVELVGPVTVRSEFAMIPPVVSVAGLAWTQENATPARRTPNVRDGFKGDSEVGQTIELSRPPP
jgi:hypothetical protein